MESVPAVQASVDELLTSWVTWSRFRGAAYATVILKATLTLAHGRLSEVETPEPVRWIDKKRLNGALDRAEEIAPFSACAGVLVHGFAYAGAATPRSPAYARVAVGVERPVVDKAIAVVSPGKVPLRWEESLLTHDNPVGTEDPRIVDPRDPSRACGMSPVSPSWEGRVKYLPSPFGHHPDFVEMPDRIDPRFFNPAPPDQQCPFLSGNEAVILTNLVPEIPEFQSWLPQLSVRGQVAFDGALAQMTFALDMLTIDAEASRASVVWRGTTPLPPSAKKLLIQAKLLGSFDRTHHSKANAPLPPPPPSAPEAPVVAQRVTPPPPPPPPEARKLVRVPNPRATVIDRVRNGGSLEDLDLEGVDLHDIDLSGRSLAYSKLDGANLKGGKLSRANLSHASLVGAILEGAQLDGANLESANLWKARADKAVLNEADLSDADASRASFGDAKLKRVKANHAKLVQTNLVGADFEYGSLDFANLERSSLDDASFVGASLADANLEKCVAEGSRFSKARLARANMKQIRLVSAIMTGVDLTGANLERADLSKARVDSASLDEANATGAKWIAADLTATTLRGTNFAGADLTGARLKNTDRSTANLAGANLKNVAE